MKRSVKTAIVLPLLAALVLGIGAMAVIVGTVSSGTASNLTNATIEASVGLYSREFSELCQGAYGTVTSVVPLVDGARGRSGTRDITDPRGYVIEMLGDVLMTNDSIMAIWTCWEPNAFDGRDEDFAGDAGHDASGRFVPYLVKGAGGITLDPLTDYDDPVAGNYYQGALTTARPYMTDPYNYSADGRDVLMCSIAIPIVANGRAVGVVGVDVDIDGFIETMNASNILGDGYLFVVSPGGLITTHPSAELIMQQYTGITWMADYEDEFNDLMQSGGIFEGSAYSSVLQDDMRFQIAGVMIGDTGRYWAVCGVVPASTVSSAANQLLLIIIVIGAALFLIVGGIAYVITGRSLAPLVPLTAFLGRAAETGDIILSPEDTASIQKYARKKDELGKCIAGAAGFTGHIGRVSETLEAIAGGDLTVDVHLLSERDTMGLSLQKMTDNLNRMFGDISLSSNQVSTGAHQIADGAQALAAGSTQQAASIQELSGSVSEIAERTRANAEMAEQAAKLAESVKGNAEKGSRQMNEMMGAVKQIHEASQAISKVIKTIDDIAFQTNILALNAAVEAARAGQHGKGFAVVAEEVRNLAAKSAEAASDTESMIANSMSKAEFGVRIAGETSSSLSEIVSGINESGNLIMEIANSSEAQSAGIAEVNIGIDQVAQVVQQNSATAEQSAAAAEEMSGQSALLQELLSQFRVKNTAAALPAGGTQQRLTQGGGF